MSSDWIEYSLDDVIEKRNQGVNTTTEKVSYSDKGIKVIRANNISQGKIDFDDCVFVDQHTFDRIKEPCKPKFGDILYTNIGSQFGNAAKVEVDFDFTIAWNVLRIQPRSEIDADFLVYLLNNPENKKYIQSLNSSSTMPFVSGGEIGKVTFHFPGSETQKIIGKKLRVLDDKIELNRQTNQTLEQIAQALFKSWFVDFEPTRAKIAAKEAGASPEEIERAAICAISGKTPDQLTQLPPETQQNLKTTAALFPDALVDSELGEVPEGWEVKQLSELGNIVCGKTPPKDNPEYYDGDIPFIKIPDMHGKMYATKTTDTLTHSGADTQIKKLLPKDSVCVSCIATVGLVSLTCIDSFTNQQINTIVPTQKNYSQYIYFAMLGLNDHLHDLASGGSATLNLNTGHFSKIKIVFPDEEVLNDFSNQVKPIFDLILKQSFEIDSLEKIRDSLLPKLLSGELDISTNFLVEE